MLSLIIITFGSKKVVSIESTRVELDTEMEKDGQQLSEQQVDELCGWMKDTLAKRVTIVRVCGCLL